MINRIAAVSGLIVTLLFGIALLTDHSVFAAIGFGTGLVIVATSIAAHTRNL